MQAPGKLAIHCLIAASLPGQLAAWQPNANDLNTAIKSGDFTGYLATSALVATAALAISRPAPGRRRQCAMMVRPQRPTSKKPMR